MPPTGAGPAKDMELRDWFAGQAVVGMLTNANPADADTIAKKAYAIADEMLKARFEDLRPKR